MMFKPILFFILLGTFCLQLNAKDKIIVATDSLSNPISKTELILNHFASKFKVNDSCFLVPSLYVQVNDWLGTPYRYGKMSRKGTDCSGFVSQIFKEYTTEILPRSASGMSKAIEPKPQSELKEGDLVFFNYYGKINSHVGIYLQNGWFIHASSKNGVTLNNLFSNYYQKKFSKGGPLKIGSLQDLIAN